MSQVSILSLFGLDDCLPAVQNSGQGIPGPQDRNSSSIDDNFALFIDWEPEIPQECPRKRPKRFANFAQKSVDGKAFGIHSELEMLPTSELNSFHRFQLDHFDIQQGINQQNQSENLLEESPPATSWSEDLGPSAKHWEDALRMIETLKGEHVWPTKEEDIQQLAEAEDKRRRNNAASARFRVNKRQREEELTKKVRGLKEKANDLAALIAKLEEENRDLTKLVLLMKEE